MLSKAKDEFLPCEASAFGYDQVLIYLLERAIAAAWQLRVQFSLKTQ